ncbi:MAG: N-acetylmuramoyl-L-alanine amidase [Deltaproteobacteria bacterium]|nr:N-acetylmuramoyl-L-alanine amidase [Deltaproteobacteria bacterium]
MFNKKTILAMLSISFLALMICGIMDLSAAEKKHIIVIDPAHGGQEAGIKLTDSAAEKDITLAVALSLKKELTKEKNVDVILTRDSDKTISLEDRKKNIEKIKPDLLLSLHVNGGFGKNAEGFEVYYPEFGEDTNKEKKTAKDDKFQLKSKCQNDSLKMAKIIQENLNNLFPRRGRGLRKADLPVTDGLLVPSLTVEMSFATNPEDKKKLLSSKTQGEISQSLAKSVRTFFR